MKPPSSDEASWNASIAWAKRRGLPITSRDYHSLTVAPVRMDAAGKVFEDEGSNRLCRSSDEGAQDPKTQDPRPTARGRTWLWRESEIGRGSNEAALRNDRGSMRARYIIESERWSEMKGQSTFDNIEELFALGLSAVNLGDARARARRSSTNSARRLRRRSPRSCASRPRSCCVKWRRSICSRRAATPRRLRCWIAPPRCRRGCRSRSAGRFRSRTSNELYGELLLQVNRREGSDHLVQSLADANAESQPRVTWTGARVSQRRRRRRTRARPTSAS